MEAHIREGHLVQSGQPHRKACGKWRAVFTSIKSKNKSAKRAYWLKDDTASEESPMCISHRQWLSVITLPFSRTLCESQHYTQARGSRIPGLPDGGREAAITTGVLRNGHREAGGRKKRGKGTLSRKLHSLFNSSSPNFSTKWKMFHEPNHFLRRKTWPWPDVQWLEHRLPAMPTLQGQGKYKNQTMNV